MMAESCLENRKSCRYDAVRDSIYIGWWEESEFRCHAAILRNLSQGGALVDLTVPPPEEGTLYLCLGNSPSARWSEAAVVAVANPRERVYRARMTFPEGCSYEMFNLAVFGIAGNE